MPNGHVAVAFLSTGPQTGKMPVGRTRWKPMFKLIVVPKFYQD
jgi:hypothetical protein